jgi:multidrug transporter EmrE-like cation transporter
LLSSALLTPQTVRSRIQLRRHPVAMVFLCTIFGAAAQVLIKSGANTLRYPTFQQTVWAAITNVPLVAGYSLYGISTMLLILALKRGQLSILYPVIALTYVWVTALSVMIFDETMNVFKLLGVALIVCGVAVLGRGGPK